MDVDAVAKSRLDALDVTIGARRNNATAREERSQKRSKKEFAWDGKVADTPTMWRITRKKKP